MYTMYSCYSSVGAYAFDSINGSSVNPEFPCYCDADVSVGEVIDEENHELDALLCNELGLVPNDYEQDRMDYLEYLHVLEVSAYNLWDDKKTEVVLCYGGKEIESLKLRKKIASECHFEGPDSTDHFINFCMRLILAEEDND